MTGLKDKDPLLKRIAVLRSEYDRIIKRLTEIGACSTMEKIKKECGLKISILDDLIELERSSDKADKHDLAEKAYSIIDRDDTGDKSSVLIDIFITKEDPAASLFMSKIIKAYRSFSKENRWSFKVLSDSYSKKGLLKEVTVKISGTHSLRYLKYESGQHQVIKDKKSSIISVSVYPEVPKKEIKIDPADIRVDVSKSSGPGGQSVNTSDSSVEITHIPTGLTAKSQQERTQSKNKDIAMQILRSKIIKAEKENLIKSKKTRRDEILFGSGKGIVRTYDLGKDIVQEQALKKSFIGIDTYLKEGIGLFLNTMVEGEEIRKIDSYFIKPLKR